MIKYLGSKRVLIPCITACVSALPGVASVADLFSGTARVGHALKREGYQLHSNDLNQYAHILARCYVEADASELQDEAISLIRHLNGIPGKAGYITENYCLNSRFFQPHNGERIDAIRDEIERLGLDPLLKAIALTSLMEAADRVDSTTGVQMAYLKSWAARSYNQLQLRVPSLTDKGTNDPSCAYNQDALEIAARLDVDCVYLDPPYNQHSYLGNYHIWETLVAWDQPSLYGVAMKRIDCKERKSVFNSKRLAQQAFTDLVMEISSPNLIISFNNEGYIDRACMEAMLAQKGHVLVVEVPYKRYVGAQIGIYNPSGNLVGEISHLKNMEYIYVVSKEQIDIEDIRSNMNGSLHQSGQLQAAARRNPCFALDGLTGRLIYGCGVQMGSPT
jgi:adenine-specific DNA-methyltransferase